MSAAAAEIWAAARPSAGKGAAHGAQDGGRCARSWMPTAEEFGAKEGFHEGSISGITRRAGVALGSFYTISGSKGRRPGFHAR